VCGFKLISVMTHSYSDYCSSFPYILPVADFTLQYIDCIFSITGVNLVDFIIGGC